LINSDTYISHDWTSNKGERTCSCSTAGCSCEVDYTGGISKCGDRRVRTLLYEAANVMLTRYKGQLKLKDWAFAIAQRSTMRKARVALARRLAIIMHAMLRDGTEFASA
jgi:transposase